MDVGEPLSTAQRSCQRGHGLTANPGDVLGASMGEHSPLAEPDIRHVLSSSRSPPHRNFTACLHSNLRQQERGCGAMDIVQPLGST